MSVTATVRLAVACALVCLGFGAGAQAPKASGGATETLRLGAPAPAAPTGDRAVFVTYGCYQCHGYEGQGGDAPRIAPTAYPFPTFAARVRKPANEMPAYAPNVLSDTALQAIYRYVRSKATPEPIALSSPP